MKCKGGQDHTKTMIAFKKGALPDAKDYASIFCAEPDCGIRIGHLDKLAAEAWEENDSMQMEELREVAEEVGEDVRGTVTGICSPEAVGEIRAIVRDEMAKVLQAMANAMKA